MNTPREEGRTRMTRTAAAFGALLLIAACSPAEKSEPVAPSPPAAAAPAATTPVVAMVEEAAPAAATPAPAPTQETVRPPAAPAATAPPPVARPEPAPTVVASTPVRVGLPAGPGREMTQQLCTSCHAIGMVTATGRTSDGWAEIIERMMGLGLEASDEDLQTVHAYLTREFSPRRTN